MRIAAIAVAMSVSAASAGGLDVSLAPSRERGLYLPADTPELTLVVTNGTDAAAELALDFSVTDYFGERVRSWKETLPVAAGGSVAKPIPFSGLKKMGYYCATAKWSGSGLSGVAEGSLVKVGPLPEKPDPLFGISGYAPNDGETFSRMGVGTKAVALNWRSLEDKDGKLNVEKALASIRSLKAKGIKVVAHTDVPPRTSTVPRRYLKKKYAAKEDPFAAPESFLADYEKFAFELVSAFKDEVHEWAAVNEINLTANMRPYMRQRYIDCVKAFSRGMRRADPKATLVAMGCSGADGREKPRYPFLRGLLPSIVESIDGFGIDQYTAGQDYGKGRCNLDSEQAEIRDIMLEAVRIAKANGKPIVTIDEKGPSIVRATPLSSQIGRRMSDIVARDYILLKTVPEVGHWLYFRPFNWDPKSVIDYGMWEKANPRQVVSAYAATARLMAGAEFVKHAAIHKDIPAWIFRKTGRFFATVWYNGPDVLEFRLPKGAHVEAFDLQGNAIDLGNGVLVLSSSPIYLFATTETNLDNALDGAMFDMPDMDAVMFVAAGGRYALSVRNIGVNPIKVEMSGTGEVPLALAPGETKTVLTSVDSGTDGLLLKSSSGRMLKVSAPLPPYRVRRVSGFDGLSGANGIRLDDPSRQAPSYADLKSNGLYSGTDDLSATARFGYDDRFFYIEVLVKDDIHRNANLPQRVFAGDCVQFAFDTLNDGRLMLLKGYRGFGDDDYNICAGLVDGQSVMWCYGAAAANRERMSDKQIAKPDIVRDDVSKITCYRIAIPFADLVPLKFEKGTVFGFSFLVFDQDPKEGLYRIEATPGIAGSPDPSRFLTFILD